MKRRLCSYDMAEVPEQGFVLADQGGEMFFCNLRCLSVWSVQLATRHNLADEQRSGGYTLNTQSGQEHRFEGGNQVARWAVDQALGSPSAADDLNSTRS